MRMNPCDAVELRLDIRAFALFIVDGLGRPRDQRFAGELMMPVLRSRGTFR